MATKNPQPTEVDAYTFIKEELEKLNWNVKNPARNPDGEVYKQNEALYNEEIKKCWGLDRAEAVVKLTENKYWVIEGKRKIHDIDKALDEAINWYAAKINKSKNIKCVIASGVAGNDTDGYIVVNRYLKGNKWEKILVNGAEKTSLLSKKQAEYIVKHDKTEFNDFPEFSEKKYLSAAEKINETLHLAAINKSKRAKFIAGVILSYAAKTMPNLEKDTVELVKEINDNIAVVLNEKGKSEFLDYITLQLPPNSENHKKYKNAIVKTYRELNGLDINSAMNSGNDILGKFYEVFLKYGDGAKEIGIVLTPRHVTKFAAEVIDVNYTDFVYDPTCGTGGFLVSALDHVKNNSTSDQFEIFTRRHIFGVEQEDDVVALALVNMIFRGDGRNNIIEGDCFQKNIDSSIINGEQTCIFTKNSSKNPPITKVLMNPPFSLKSSDEKEYKFVNHALKQMQRGGILFSILPSAIMIKQGAFLKWRRNELLKNNTLLSVITFPPDLFYPVSTHSIGIFVRKGIPHLHNQNVLWIRAINDGLAKKKGKRLPDPKTPNDLEQIKYILKSFIIEPNLKIENIREKQKTCPIDFSDSSLELVPEAYLDSTTPSITDIEDEMEKLIRESVAYIIRGHKEGVFLDDN